MATSATAADEPVTVLDENGQPCGVANRARVREANLLHGATAILVRDQHDRVYVHRRTHTKDIYPGAYDCWAGGVLAHGEDPASGAARELAEELGVVGAPLTSLFTTRWRDTGVQAIYYAYTVTWNGPIVHQPAEVSWGEWWTTDVLVGRLAERDFTFAPDGRHLLVVAGILPARHESP